MSVVSAEVSAVSVVSADESDAGFSVSFCSGGVTGRKHPLSRTAVSVNNAMVFP